MQQLTSSPQRAITKTIWIISLVSLFTDMASEMLYPIMPIFLKHIGFGVLLIGILEGFAEAVAGLTKPFFGKQSDAIGKRLPFVQLGYTLSALSKPMMALLFYPIWIFFARTIDRLGKGIRSGARDAMLSDECTKENKAKVFGFHRSMDTLGAVIGPIIALVYLYFFPFDYKTLFLLAFLPGIAAVFCTFLIKEKNKPSNIAAPNLPIKLNQLFNFTSYWKVAPQQYKKLVLGLLLFALFNSSDVFLLLKMKESGFTDTTIISIYIFYNLIFALLAYPVGILADKLGLKNTLLTGLILFAIVYFGFAFTNNLVVYIVLFGIYGMYAAATDGISKAWISNIVPKSETATAIGTLTGFQSLAALFASSFCGLLWYNFGSITTFLATALVTIPVVIYLNFKLTKKDLKLLKMKAYETVTEALADLKKRNFTIDFNIAFDKIICSKNEICLNPNEFEIVETYRFEGDTNPSDEDIVYAIASTDDKIKGTITSAYGMYAESISTDMINKLSSRN